MSNQQTNQCARLSDSLRRSLSTKVHQHRSPSKTIFSKLINFKTRDFEIFHCYLEKVACIYKLFFDHKLGRSSPLLIWASFLFVHSHLENFNWPSYRFARRCNTFNSYLDTCVLSRKNSFKDNFFDIII